MKEGIELLLTAVPLLQKVPAWILYPALIGIACGVMLGWVSVMVMVWVYLERKIAGHIQARYGPMRVGPHGILQTIADAIKLLIKEDIIPKEVQKTLFILAPWLVFAGAFVPFLVLPFSDQLLISRMNVGLFFVLAIVAIEVVGVIMAGWASNNKWSLYGGMRLAAQMISYEIPMGIAALCVVFFAGSLQLDQIVAAQGSYPWQWFISPLKSPWTCIAGLVFYVCAYAATKRLPFDLPEAESELVAGFHTEYSGMRFAFFFLAEYAAMYLFCALTAILFLGGWRGPLPEPLGPLNIMGKTFFLLFVMIWVRWTLPRLRIDQVINVCLKGLLPVSLLCLIGAGIQAVLF